MSERDFCYFLQGFIELNGGVPTETQWQQIKDHLNLVFNKVTPNYYAPNYSNLDLLPLKLPPGTYC